MKFETDIADPQSMNSTDFDDSLTFNVLPPARQSSYLAVPVKSTSAAYSLHFLFNLSSASHPVLNES